MNLKKMTKDELEKLSHLDIAYHIIKDDKKTYNAVDLFKKVCKLLDYGEDEFENLIGDFYTSLNLDKRFLIIDGKWDLTENHAVKMIVDDEVDDDDIESYEDMDEEDEELTEIEDEAVLDDAEALEDVEDDLDDEMEDLTILSEEEMEEEESL